MEKGKKWVLLIYSLHRTLSKFLIFERTQIHAHSRYRYIFWVLFFFNIWERVKTSILPRLRHFQSTFFFFMSFGSRRKLCGAGITHWVVGEKVGGRESIVLYGGSVKI
jgi:hypothetical protein